MIRRRYPRLRAGLTLALLAGLVPVVAGGTSHAEADPVLVGAGDIAACNTSGDEATATLLDDIVTGPADTVFTTGDNVYPDGTASEFANCYEPTWGRHKARTRPSLGNHDAATDAGAPYYDYFGALAGEAGKGYYSYDVGGWHVVALNTQCSLVGGCGANSPQGLWLEADLAAHPSECIAAYWHKPRYTSGASHGPDTRWTEFWEILQSHGADVVIGGHDHVYERFAPQDPYGNADPNGIRQFVVGTGGKSLYSFGAVQPNSEVRYNASYGVLKLTLHPTAYSWDFVPVEGAPTTQVDSGTASCHGSEEVLDTVITSGPSDTITDTSATFSFESNDPDAGFECSLDGASFAACTSPTTYDGLADGDHTFGVRAVTGDGTVDPSPAERTFTVASGDGATLTLGPVGDTKVVEQDPTRNAGSSTTLVADGDPVFESYLLFDVPDLGGAAVSGATLELWVKAGTSDGPAVYLSEEGWDEHAVTWGNRPGRTSGVITEPGALPAGEWASFDVGAAVAGPGQYSFNLATENRDGARFHTKEADSNHPRLVLDLAGDGDDGGGDDGGDGGDGGGDDGGDGGDGGGDDPVEPDTVIDGGPSGTILTDTATFTFSSPTGATSFECRLDSAPFEACTSPKTYTGLADGAYTFAVRALADGLADSTPATQSFAVATGTLTFVSAADAYVWERHQDRNYGNESRLEVDAHPVYMESYVRFDVSGLGGGSVERAVLRLQVNNASGVPPALYPAGSGWTETGITWLNRPARTGGALPVAPVVSGGWLEYDVTSLVAGDGTYTFVLAISDGKHNSAVFSAREAGGGPELVITRS